MSPEEAKRAEFMRRKYAELIMAHNVPADELDELEDDRKMNGFRYY